MKPRTEKSEPLDAHGVPYIGLDDVEAHTTKLIGSKDSATMKSSAKNFYKGDVLYSRLRPYLNKVWLADREGLCSAEFIVLPQNEWIDGHFLKYRLNSRDFVMFANSLNAGDRPRVDFDQISSFILPPFSLAYQRTVVAKIEELFSELDAGIESLKTARAQLKIYRQALLKHAFEGKLTEQWRKDHADQLESADQLLARVTKERLEASTKEAERPREAEDLNIPSWWAIASIDLVTREASIGLVRSAELQNFDGTGVSYIKMDRVNMDGAIDLNPEVYVPCDKNEVIRYQLEKGDILFNTRNSVELVGKIGIVSIQPTQPTVFNNNLMRIRVVGSVLPEFLNYQMCSPEFRARMEKVKKATTSVAAVYGKDLKPLPIVLPSVLEQQEIVRILEEKLSEVVHLQQDIESQLILSEALRQSILKKAFSGQLVAQDPADEPASVLLARIRAERENVAKSGSKKILRR
ncbi:MAG: restriction endonuclease subunit S [Luteolibacter sp.]